MQRVRLIVIGALLVVLSLGMSLVGQEEAVEVSLGASILHGIHYFVDPWGNELQWLPELYAFIETIEDDLDLFETKVVADLADLEIDVAAVETKLDTEIRWTDDAELAIHEAAVIAEIDANEVKIDIVDANVDQLLLDVAVVDANVDQLLVDVASVEAKLDHWDYGLEAIDDGVEAVEAKLDHSDWGLDAIDTEVEFVMSELAHATYGLSELRVQIDANEAKLDIVDTNVDDIEARIFNEIYFTDDNELNVIEVKLDDLETDLDGVTAVVTHVSYGNAALLAEINANESKIDSVIAFVDTMEADLKTFITAENNLLETKLDNLGSAVVTVDTVVDAILVDTDTMEADLKTFITAENNLLEVKLDAFVDNTALLNTMDGKLDAIATVVGSHTGVLNSIEASIDDGDYGLEAIDDGVEAAEAKLDLIGPEVSSILAYIDTMETDLRSWMATNITDYVNTEVAEILDDTDTMEADLNTFITNENNLLETKLDNIDVDTTAILADTDTLEADLITWMTTNIKDYIDTEIAAIKAVVDLINTNNP